MFILINHVHPVKRLYESRSLCWLFVPCRTFSQQGCEQKGNFFRNFVGTNLARFIR